MDPSYEGSRAWSLLRVGRYTEAAWLFRQVCDETHLVDQEYNRLATGMAEALANLERHADAAYVFLYLGRFGEAQAHMAGEAPLDRARVLEQSGALVEAAALYREHQRPVLAAIAYERGEALAEAAQCWEQACRLPSLAHSLYVQALVHFNLAYCALGRGDDAGHGHLVTAQRLLEEVADEFETAGQRERAFDCYQILLEMGRRSGAFENLAEGYLNCIRILKEDHLKFYVLQYYEDFLREAQTREEYHAAASLYREAADYCLRLGLIYDRYYLKSSAETWLVAAEKNRRENGPSELAENALLAAVACYNTLGDYRMVGEAYRRLAKLPLGKKAQERYARITPRYTAAGTAEQEAPHFPNYLKQPHAYPEIWFMDLLEWEHDGDVAAVTAAVIGDTSYPDVVRRRALNLLLDCREPGALDDPARLSRIAERLGDLQIYVVLRPLERLFEHPSSEVKRGVMRALRFLFFKRSFGLLRRGLESEDVEVRQTAIDALKRLYFNHAFDPLVRIYREFAALEVRTTALESIGRIPSLEAGDFLIEVLRHEPEPLRSVAKRLLTAFENQELLPILHQHFQMETGQLQSDLEQILQKAGARVSL